MVIESVGPTTMPWIDHVTAVLEAWYPGTRGGEAIAKILFGEVNPSAKLPVTFAKSDADLPHPTGMLQPPPRKGDMQPMFPGAPWMVNTRQFDIEYNEGLLVGYKWFDAKDKQPLFPFGFGLYTTYSYSGLKVAESRIAGLKASEWQVAFAVKNTGKRAGAEIAEAYATLPQAAGEPFKRLVAFKKIALEPGESKSVTLSLNPHYLSIFNEDKNGWESGAGRVHGAGGRFLARPAARRYIPHRPLVCRRGAGRPACCVKIRLHISSCAPRRSTADQERRHECRRCRLESPRHGIRKDAIRYARTNMKRREFLMTIPALSATALPSSAGPADENSAPDLTLWYTRPAEGWVDGLPLGNGRLGAMALGSAPKERIFLNEATLWSGSPHNVNPPDGEKTLAEVRRLVLEEKDYHAADQAAHKLQGTYTESYQPLGELRITLEGTSLDGYRRELNIDTAVCTTTHGAGPGSMMREVLVSAPDQVVAVRIETRGGARLNCRVELASLLKNSVTVEGTGRLRMQAKAPAHVDPNYIGSPNPVIWDDAEGKGMRCEALLDARAEGGTVRADGVALHIEDATAATLLVAAGTGFRGFDRMPDLSADAIHAACAKTLDAAARKSWPALKAAHVTDHQRLFRRMEFSLGPGGPGAKLPTDERVKDYPQRPDPSLAALYFQFGRYLLIASSRPGGQPANLQGLWSDILRPAWSANYTTNINVEMNYWPAETCNLSECHAPLFDMIEELSRTGAKTARELYGMPGWTVHHNTDLWRASNPVGDGRGDPNWANWAMAAPWLCEHVWEHYRFTGDANSCAGARGQ